jgi:hypothetical protein
VVACSVSGQHPPTEPVWRRGTWVLVCVVKSTPGLQCSDWKMEKTKENSGREQAMDGMHF